MKLKLVRYAYLHEATLGRLYVDDLTLATLEDPWIPDPDGPGGQRREQGKHESCVPDGMFDLVPHSGVLQRDVWALVNRALGVFRYPGDVPDRQWGRSGILIHSGNTVENSLGCILVGLSHGRQAGKDWIYESRKAIEHLRVKLGTQTHQLFIRPIAGTAEIGT